MELNAGFPEDSNLSADSSIGQDPNPWVRQFFDDMGALCLLECGIALSNKISTRYASVFSTDDSKQMFIAIDVSEICAKYTSNSVPPPGLLFQAATQLEEIGKHNCGVK